MKTFAELNFPGRLIAVEGLDGSGKSTQIYLLKRWLEAEGVKVYFSQALILRTYILIPAALERQIAATDTQIDRLVYDLYGLTEDETKIVKGEA